MLFANLTRDTANAYLSDGLASEIATSLARIPRLEVRSPGAMRSAQRGVEPDPRVVGRRLNVRYIVEGDFQRGGDRIRVSVRLVGVPSGTQRWSESYTRPVSDLLAVQEEIARSVTTAIAGALLPDERATLSARTTRNPEAHDRVMRGNYLLTSRNETNAKRAVEEYRAAIALDSGYAEAWARLGWVYSIFRNWGWQVPGLSGDSVLRLAGVAARRALALDSASALAWFASASVAIERDAASLQAGATQLDRALSLDPRLAEAHWIRATIRLRLGDMAAAMASAHRALELEPDRPITLTWIGLAALTENRLDVARRWLDSAVAIAPTFFYALSNRAGVRALQGDRGALADAANGLRAGGSGDSALAYAIAAFSEAWVGDTATARLITDRLRGAIQSGTAGATFDELAAWLAAALLRLGSRDAALEVLEHAQPTSFLRIYLRYPFFDAVRDDPRFRRVVASVAGR